MLDAARGAVEWGVIHKLLPAKALADIKRPYGLKAPSPPPTAATLERKYGFKEKQPDEESYNTIRFSLMDLGDFGRYVVESGVHNFSRYRYGEDFPEREKWRSWFSSRAVGGLSLEPSVPHNGRNWGNY